MLPWEPVGERESERAASDGSVAEEMLRVPSNLMLIPWKGGKVYLGHSGVHYIHCESDVASFPPRPFLPKRRPAGGCFGHLMHFGTT